MKVLIRLLAGILLLGPGALAAQAVAPVDTSAMGVFLADLARFQALLTSEQSFGLTMEVELTQAGEVAAPDAVRLDHQPGRTRVQYGELLKLVVDTVALTVDEDKRLLSVGLNADDTAASLTAGQAQLSAELAPYARISAETEKLRTYTFALAGAQGVEIYEAQFDKQGGFFPLTRIVFRQGVGQSDLEAIAVKTALTEFRLPKPISLTPYLATCEGNKLCLGADYQDYRVLSVSPHVATQFNLPQAQ